MIPISAPFGGVAVHVVNAPCIWRIGADFDYAFEMRPFFGSVIRGTEEIGLETTELVAKGGCGCGPGSTGLFPLRFGGESDFPFFGNLPRSMG